MNKVLWTPESSNLKKTKMARFMSYVNQEYNLSIKDYADLHKWSISSISEFWQSVSNFFLIYYHTKPVKIVKNESDMFNAKWFLNAELNYAENLLMNGELNANAIEFYNELGDFKALTYDELAKQVLGLILKINV